ncbi:MAG: hemolysin family protein [Eubacterium sp.]
MDIPLGWQLFIQLVLIAVNAVFASAEIAIVSMNDLKLEQLAAQGNKRAKRLVKLTNKPAGFLATIQVAITLSGFLGSAFAADNFSDIIVDWLIGLGVPIKASTLNTIAVVVITIILSYLTLVFGELVPKRIAMKKTEQMALGLSGLIYLSSKIFAPLVALLTASTNLVLRVLRINPDENEEEVSEEEIRMMVDVGSQKGVIDVSEKNMIVNVFEFDDKDCGEFSTHRKDIVALDVEDSAEEWYEIIKQSNHSLYPVFKESIDNVVAVLDAKQFFRAEDKSKENIEKTAFLKPVYVPDSMKIDVLFNQMQKSHNHFAVVLDEYGGTVGIITMNDLLEQIVGNLEEEEPYIVAIDENSWKMKGLVSLDDVAQVTKVKLPVDEYETLSGYILGVYCKIPKDGSAFEVETDELKFDVLNIRKHTVEMCIVTVK